MSELLTAHALAKALGVSRAAVRKAAASGRLDRARHGERFDLAVAVREWNVNRRDGADGTITDSRKRYIEARARAAEHALGVTLGRYVLRTETLAAWAVLIGHARTALEGLPSRLKARLPQLTTADLVVIADAVADVLTELAGDDEKAKVA